MQLTARCWLRTGQHGLKCTQENAQRISYKNTNTSDVRIPGSKSQLKSGKKMIIIITRSTTTIAWRIHVGWETREEEECQEMASDATTHSHRKRRGQHCASGGSPLMIGTRGGMRMAYLLKGLLWGCCVGKNV